MKGPSFIILKHRKYLFCITFITIYLTLFFFVQSDFVIYVNSGVTCNTYLRDIADLSAKGLSYIFSPKRSDIADKCIRVLFLLSYDDRFLLTLHTTVIY